MDEGAIDHADPTEVDKFAWHWHRAKRPFIKEGIEYLLQFRIATVEDRKKMGQPKRSRFLWNRKYVCSFNYCFF